MRNSLMYSRKAGIWTALGIALGNFVHITYSVAAIVLIVSLAEPMLTVVRYLGVAYIAYLGVKTILAKSNGQSNDAAIKNGISAFAAFRTGFLANLLNPGASLFFASIFATVLSSGFPVWVLYTLWIAMPLNSLFMASFLSVFFSHAKIKALYARYERFANIILGGALLLLAVLIALK
ncbi:MAG: LysE family transporter [Candidatus Kaiserbacteria bacterium]|nr:MAG: LysE family transporter [Candidatus Kaiserbacteria bacterium]